MSVNTYYNLEKIAEAVRAGEHRDLVGGMWDRIGRMQFDFIRAHGLTPQMRIVDLGCGCLRAGIHFVDYLDSGNYYGIDISPELIEAGYAVELAQLGLQAKLPRQNLAVNWQFEAEGFGVAFDVAIAQSVFTHLPLNHMKLCMTKAASYVRPGGAFYMTVFHSPETHDWTQPLNRARGGIVSHPDRDPFHYRERDLLYAIEGLPWTLESLSDWQHPRDQSMALFRRMG